MIFSLDFLNTTSFIFNISITRVPQVFPWRNQMRKKKQ